MNKKITFNDLVDIHLSNKQINIRRYVEGDFDGLNAQFDTSIFKWFFTAYNNCKEFTDEKLSKFHKHESITYVVIDNKLNKIVGTFSLVDMSIKHRYVEVGSIWFGKEYVGSFYNTMTLLLILEYLFEKLHFNRVQWKTDKLNERSQNAAKSLGFIYEGTLRKHIITQNDRNRDTVIFAIINDDWDGAKKIIQDKVKLKLKDI